MKIVFCAALRAASEVLTRGAGSMRGRVASFVILSVAVALAACNGSVNVGEVRVDDPTAPAEAADAGAPQPGPTENVWFRHAPLVPCSIYALAEVRADQIFVGCFGGQVYRFDGVTAKVDIDIGDAKAMFSLLWASSDGQVFAVAHGPSKTAPSVIYRWDGSRWGVLSAPSRRITSIGGTDASHVWMTTDDAIYRFGASGFEKVFDAPGGAFRACAFANTNKGYCTGLHGLAAAWNGTAWSAVTNGPWSPQATVFGVESDPESAEVSFFYGEPVSGSEYTCHIARTSGSTFKTFSASTQCSRYDDDIRKATGSVVVGTNRYMLVASDDQYGSMDVFDTIKDEVRPVCGPVLAFSVAPSQTRVAGHDGFLGALVGTGGDQVTLEMNGDSAWSFEDLSVAPDGTPWARVRSRTVCTSSDQRLVRFEQGAWRPVVAPLTALVGFGLSAIDHDHAQTINPWNGAISEYVSGNWIEHPTMDTAWSLDAKRADDVWIGGAEGSFGHFDGKIFAAEPLPFGPVQIDQITTAGDDVWIVASGRNSDTDTHIVRRAGGAFTEWKLAGGYESRLSVVDATHIYRSGRPAAEWNGTEWKDLGFDADKIWARAPDEIYYTAFADIYRWNGRSAERVHHGLIPITALGGTKEHGFAVGSGGLTLELRSATQSPAR